MDQAFADLCAVVGDAEIGGANDGQSRITAGIDGLERRKVDIDVQCEAVIATAIAYTQSERSDLGITDINPGGLRPAMRRDAVSSEYFDDGLFHQSYQRPH